MYCDTFLNHCMLIVTSFSQLSQPGHEKWWITKSDVNTSAFGPNPYVLPQGNQKQTGEGGWDKFISPNPVTR